MAFDPRHSVDDGLHHLSVRLDPIISEKLKPNLGGLPWTTVLTELDRMRGRPPKQYMSTDLQAQLKVLTERLGNLGFPFDDHTRLVSALGNELRIVRNRWAHHDDLATIDAWRTHDFAVRLLEHFGDERGVKRAEQLRDAALTALAEEKGIAGHVAVPLEDVTTPSARVEPATEDEIVRPDPGVLTRADPSTPTIGSVRGAFEPWTVVLVGDLTVLDQLPKKAAKEKVRAVASEIVEFEGPIHVDRLAQLAAASFGVQRLHAAREKKLAYQIRQSGLLVDNDKFVWPTELDPATWSEFRPNDSTVDRPFTEISPVEIANAMRVIMAARPDLSEAALDAAALQTFGRKRRTRAFSAHLDRARNLL